MKRMKFVAVVALFACSMTAHAQTKVSSLTLGFAPIGDIQTAIKLDNEDYKYKYKSYWNANIGYEKQLKGAVTLTEISFVKAAFKDSTLTGNSVWFNPRNVDDVYMASVTQYVGVTINPNKRVQFPLYIGVGGDYINGGPLHNIMVSAAAKARLKFYFTNSIGIYVGASGRYGYGVKSASETSDGDSYGVSAFSWSADAGLIIGF